MNRIILLSIITLPVVLLSACTGPLNSETVKSKPTGYLCRILGPDYLTMPSEQEAIYGELDRRGERCLPSQRIVIENI